VKSPVLHRHHFQLELEDDLLPIPGEPEVLLARVLEVPVSTAPGTSDLQETGRRRWAPPWLLASLGLHGLLLLALIFLVKFTPLPPPSSQVMDVVPIDLSTMDLPEPGGLPEIHKGSQTPPEPEDMPDPEAEKPRGQFVNLPPAPDQPMPKNARYMAADNQVALQETQARQVQNSPDVVASRFSKDSHDAGDEGSDERTNRGASSPATSEANPPPSSAPPQPPQQEAAVMGNPQVMERTPSSNRPMPSAPSRPSLNLMPTPGQLVAMFGGEGSGEATRSRGSLGPRSGAPDNNVLDVAGGDETALNAQKTEYARFFNALRKQFNYYYGQASDNLSTRELGQRVFEKTYITRFEVTLAADGQVTSVRILSSAGVQAFDGLVHEALRNASPFPAPPRSLLDARGELVLGGECRLGVGMGAPSFDRSRGPFGR